MNQACLIIIKIPVLGLVLWQGLGEISYHLSKMLDMVHEHYR